MKTKTKIEAFFITLVVCFLTTNYSCQKDELQSAEKDILSFSVPGQIGETTINKPNLTVEAEVECGTNLSNLAPTFTISANATSSPASGTASDYNSQRTITVTAEDGSSAAWKVNISKVCSDETDILTFTLPEQTSDATINSDNHTVAIRVAEDTDLTDLTPTFALSEGAISDPSSGTAGDYSAPVIITVTAEDGTTTQDWTVTVTNSTSNATDILTFTLPEQTGDATIDNENHTVAIQVAIDTDLTNLVPTFALSEGATSDPSSGTAGDYSAPVTITVTAEDGSTTQDWTVTVSEAASNATDILTFSLPEQTGDAIINSSIHKLVIKVADGTDLTNLTPNFTLSDGATSVPASGTTGDYSGEVSIIVTAEDGITVQEWIAKVLIEGESSDETDITSFTLPEQTGDATINVVDHTVAIEVAAGTNLNNLTPTFTLSEGATSVPASGTAGDYSSTVTITVTAEDGTTTQDWTVNVSEAVVLSDATDILSFSLPEQTGAATINSTDHTVSIEVLTGTNLANLTPSVTLSEGATSVPASGSAGDYSSAVTITVTAENGTTTQDWTVTVSEAVALSDATDILTFTLPEQTGAASINNTAHTVAIEVAEGTDLTSLTPTFTLSEGATSVPASGTAGDYSSAVTITVTAEDGSTTQDWTVNVTEAIPSGGQETDILTFSVTNMVGDAIIDPVNHTVTAKVAQGVDLFNQTLTWTLNPGATSNPASGISQFVDNIIITVTGSDATTQDWSISIYNVGNTETDIVHFILPEQTGPAIIDRQVHIVDIEVPSGTSLSNLTPTILLPDGASSSPSSGTPGDYNPVVTVTVTAADGFTTQDWKIIVAEVGNPRSTEVDILSFSFPEKAGLANISTGSVGDVDISVVNGTDRSNLTPTFTLSPGASSEPASGTPGDYSSTSLLTVTAEDGRTTKLWNINVLEAPDPNNKADIFTFSFPQQTGPADIDEDGGTEVNIEVANGTDLTNLTPTFTLSPGASAVPASGTPGDYSSEVFILVTAEDGTSQKIWSVNVTVN